jgi:purine-binding chemotaxis protein CheW
MHESTTSAARQFLSFTLGGLEYGIDAAKVQELRVLKALERIASQGEILGGVAVSRGVIMPLVDMRAACGASPAPPDPMTDVIIVRLTGHVVGLGGVGVRGMATVAPGQIGPVPGGEGLKAEHLMGLGRVEGRRLILVDIERLMSVKGQGTKGMREAGVAAA